LSFLTIKRKKMNIGSQNQTLDLGRDTLRDELHKATGRFDKAYGPDLDPQGTTSEWAAAAGLDYDVQATPVLYKHPLMAANFQFENKNVLVRQDNGSPLGVVSDGYKIHQTTEVLSIVRGYLDGSGWEIKKALPMEGGAKMAVVATHAKLSTQVLTGDEVLPMLIATTSFDGSSATTFRVMALRVVCKNGLSIPVRMFKNAVVKIRHSSVLDIDRVRLRLLADEAEWNAGGALMRRMTQKAVTLRDVEELIPAILSPGSKTVPRTGLEAILGLFKGGAIGSDIAGVQGTRWGLYNAVTEYVDYHRKPRNSGSDVTDIIAARTASALLEEGKDIKERAFIALTEM
jgi:phage/plasmid-like protein (TIGR03299 family)